MDILSKNQLLFISDLKNTGKLNNIYAVINDVQKSASYKYGYGYGYGYGGYGKYAYGNDKRK